MKILFIVLLSALVALGQDTAGIGVVVGQDGGRLVVKGILPDSPAAGSHSIHAGDRILAIAQADSPPVDVRQFKTAQAIPLLRGVQGTTVRVTTVPAGEDESHARVVSFVRGELKELARWGNGAPLPLGTKAPNIQILTLPGRKEEQLTNYVGKVVVLEFWATWCGPCQQAMAELQGYPAKYPEWDEKVVFIAASVDQDVDIATKHLKAKGWDKTHSVWVDVPAIKAYHIDGIPTAYVIDQKGDVSAGGHIEDIPAAVNRLVQPDEAYELTVEFESGWKKVCEMKFIAALGRPFAIVKKDDAGCSYQLNGELRKRNNEVLEVHMIRLIAPDQTMSCPDYELKLGDHVGVGSTGGTGYTIGLEKARFKQL